MFEAGPTQRNRERCPAVFDFRRHGTHVACRRGCVWKRALQPLGTHTSVPPSLGPSSTSAAPAPFVLAYSYVLPRRVGPVWVMGCRTPAHGQALYVLVKRCQVAGQDLGAYHAPDTPDGTTTALDSVPAPDLEWMHKDDLVLLAGGGALATHVRSLLMYLTSPESSQSSAHLYLGEMVSVPGRWGACPHCCLPPPLKPVLRKRVA